MTRNVIAFVLMVAAAATVGILAFDLYHASEDQARAQFEENQLLVARHVATELEGYLRSRSQGLRALASFASVRRKDPDQTPRDVLAYMERLGQLHVRAVSVFDENGTVRYSTATSSGPQEPARELLEWAKKPENREQLFLSCRGPRAGLCVLATPVYRDGLSEPASGFSGVVALTVDLAAFLSEEMTSEVPAMTMGLREIWIVDEGGTLLFHSHHPEMVARNVRQRTARCTECHTSFDYVERMLAVRQGTAAYQLRDRPRKLAAFAPMGFGSASWIVVVNAPYARVSAFAARHLRETLALLGVVVAALAGAATLIQRSYRSSVRAEEEARHWQQKQALEEEIRHSKTYLESILANSLDLVLTIRKDGTLGFVNRQLERITGYEREKVIGRHFLDFVPEHEKPAALEMWRRAHAGASGSYEMQVRMADGSLMDGLLSYSVVEGFDEFLVLLKDIGERKRMEQALRESEERFRNLVQGVDAIVWEADAESFAFTFVSDRAEAILGYPVRQWLEERGFWANHIHPEDRQGAVALCRQATTEGRDHEFEYRALAADGRVAFLRDIVRVARDEKGRVSRLLGLMIDVTERRAAEELLRESEERYRTIIEHSNDMIWTVDTEGRLQFFNRRSEEISGYRLEEWLGKSFASLILEEDLPGVLDVFRRTIGGDPQQYEVRIRRQDGSVLALAVNTAPIRSKGQVIGTVSFGRDITEKKRLEEQLRHSQKLEGLGQLASGIAHDFNNVLSGILGYAELGLRKLDANHPLYRNLSHIRELGERAAGITRQLLAFSRRQVLEPRDLDLNRLISDLLRLLGKTLGEHIEIDFRPNSSLKVVHADPAQMEQILVNLCVNARDAMPKGGRLVIETDNVELDEPAARKREGARPGCYAVLTVTDTGEGMDESVRAHIFEPFFTTKEPGKGTGLGLATVHGLVGQHGGFIDVQSAIGQGTTFRIYLPSVDRPAEVPEAAASKPIRGGTETILLVEDDPAVRAVTEAALREFGYDVVVAANGEGALRQLEQDASVALVVSDVVMPKMGGTELRDRARRFNTRARWLFVSGYPRGAAQEKLTADAAEFLGKPVTAAALLAKIREILDRPSSHS